MGVRGKKLAFIVLHLFSSTVCLPRPEVSEQMINDVLKSIRRVIESESNEKLDRDFHVNTIQKADDLKETKTEAFQTVTESVSSTKSINTTTINTSSTKLSYKTTTKSTATTLKSKTASSTILTSMTTTKASTTTTKNPLSKHVDSAQEELCDTVPNNYLLRNGLGSTGFTWPDGRIPYTIADGFNETHLETIEKAVNYYNEEFDGCIKWVERTDQQRYVIFENTGTCSSRIGVAFYPLPISQTINIGRCAHLLGHIKHEMMHTVGFYHEHSRSDRDEYIEIEWNNIPAEYQAQFTTYRWTVGYGEKYDYESIMHYSSRAFVRDYNDKNMRSIVPKDRSVDPDNIGFKQNLSEIDKIKIRKMYKCAPYNEYKVSCGSDEECGLNEYCAVFVGECRTKLPDGSVCILDKECLNHCGGGVCSSCEEDGHCGEAEYCAYKYLPAIQNECSGFCDSFCLFSAQCGGDCNICTWSFTCQKQ